MAYDICVTDSAVSSRRRRGAAVTAVAALGALALTTGRAAAQTKSAEPPPRSTEFQAVEGGAEMVSGGTLLVEAYCALWLILLAFLLISWRRQGRIDQRVGELEKALARGAPK
jgi:hypothetical protein